MWQVQNKGTMVNVGEAGEKRWEQVVMVNCEVICLHINVSVQLPNELTVCLTIFSTQRRKLEHLVDSDKSRDFRDVCRVSSPNKKPPVAPWGGQGLDGIYIPGFGVAPRAIYSRKESFHGGRGTLDISTQNPLSGSSHSNQSSDMYLLWASTVGLEALTKLSMASGFCLTSIRPHMTYSTWKIAIISMNSPLLALNKMAYCQY